MKSRRSLAIAMRLSPVLLIGVVPAVAAQTAAADGELEELVVTGTRAAARSVTESPVPIDVLSGEDFENQAGTDLSNLPRAAGGDLREPGRPQPHHPPQDGRAVLQRQLAADQRCRDDRPPRKPARAGARPHAGAGARQAPSSRARSA